MLVSVPFSQAERASFETALEQSRIDFSDFIRRTTIDAAEEILSIIGR